MVFVWIAVTVAFIIIEAMTTQLLTIWFAAGSAAAIVASLLSRAFKNAKEDADERRKERIQSELLRSEYEELSAELLLTLARKNAMGNTDEAIKQAEEKFLKHKEKFQGLPWWSSG